MKKNQIESIKKEIQNILAFYKYETLENNYKLLHHELYKINDAINNLYEERKQKREKFKNNDGFYTLLNNSEWQQIKNDIETKENIQAEKKEIISNTIEAYKNIINTILNDILIKILKLYFDNVVNFRDHNEFIKIFGYDEEMQKARFLIGFSYSAGYANRFDIFSRNYNELETSYYLKFINDIRNNQLIFADDEKENILKHDLKDFETLSKEKNIFNLSQIKKDIKNIIKQSNIEYKKIQKQIESSSNKINKLNIYSIRYFNNLLK